MMRIVTLYIDRFIDAIKKRDGEVSLACLALCLAVDITSEIMFDKFIVLVLWKYADLVLEPRIRTSAGCLSYHDSLNND
jgi:hypothetical protein